MGIGLRSQFLTETLCRGLIGSAFRSHETVCLVAITGRGLRKVEQIVLNSIADARTPTLDPPQRKPRHCAKACS